MGEPKMCLVCGRYGCSGEFCSPEGDGWVTVSSVSTNINDCASGKIIATGGSSDPIEVKAEPGGKIVHRTGPDVEKRAPDFLIEAISTYHERNAIYGNNYDHFGDVMAGLFPNGVTLKTKKDFRRFGVLVQMVSKMGRLCNRFDKGGHADSNHDLSVYAAILSELEQ